MHFKEYHRNLKKFKSLYGFGGCCLEIRDVGMDFEAHFKVHSLVSACPKSVILGQMTILNMIFHVVVSVYQLIKIWNSPQFLVNFGTANKLRWLILFVLSSHSHQAGYYYIRGLQSFFESRFMDAK